MVSHCRSGPAVIKTPGGEEKGEGIPFKSAAGRAGVPLAPASYATVGCILLSIMELILCFSSADEITGVFVGNNAFKEHFQLLGQIARQIG